MTIIAPILIISLTVNLILTVRILLLKSEIHQLKSNLDGRIWEGKRLRDLFKKINQN
jgi:hypothetical protein